MGNRIELKFNYGVYNKYGGLIIRTLTLGRAKDYAIKYNGIIKRLDIVDNKKGASNVKKTS